MWISGNELEHRLTLKPFVVLLPVDTANQMEWLFFGWAF